MRIRSIHPEQWTDPDFVSCTPFARLLALALRNEADDNGIFEWKPASLKLRLFPGDNLDIKELLGELERTNQVWRYEVDGREFGAIRNFHRFQSPRKPNCKHPVPLTHPQAGYSFRPVEACGGAEPVPHQYRTSSEAVQGGGGIGVGVGVGEGEGEGEGEGSNTSCAEPQGDSTPHVRKEDVFLEFPCVGKPNTWILTKDKTREYHGTYGEAVDVKTECRKALQWTRDNPRKRKTNRGMPNFLNNWLSKAVDSSRRSAAYA